MLFRSFEPRVKTHADEKFFVVESDGLPAHNMMVGITAWQQQVPLPQPYFGNNAWQFPLAPVPAAQPQTIKNHFLRGAIAIAVNGIPIFNPQNNRGEVSAEIGELDQWGGHCGRADDYHYHAAPLHLQSVVGRALPLAYALDGYAIYGLAEPDGSSPQNLDAFNGHSTAALGYHYHASTKYPYVNGGFHGEVTEAGQQVDPQPRAQPVREALPQMRGAKIVAFTNSPDKKFLSLGYTVNGRPGSVNYTNVANGQWKFRFVNTDGTSREETYSARSRPAGGGLRRGGDASSPKVEAPPPARRPGPQPDQFQRDPRPRPRGDEGVAATPPLIIAAKHSGNLVLTSPVVKDGGALPAEFNGDGAGVSPPLEWKGAPAGAKVLTVDTYAHADGTYCPLTQANIETFTDRPEIGRAHV